MSIENWKDDEYKAEQHLARMMNEHTEGTETYELARRCRNFIINKIRVREKVKAELWMKHQRLLAN